MELDQVLFKKLYNSYKKWTSKKDIEILKNQVELEPLKPRLTILARAMSGVQNDVLTSEREGGWSGNQFYLPHSISFNPSVELNIQYYLFRVLYLSIQQSLNVNWNKEEMKIIESQNAAITSAPEVLNILFEEYPNTEPIHKVQKENLENHYKTLEQETDYTWLYGRWMKKAPIVFTSSNTALNNFAKKEDEEITSELNANPSDEVQTIAARKQQEENVVTNQFETVDTLSEFNGSFKEMDGDDSLKDDEDALRELNLKHTIRSDEATHSVYQAEFVNSQANIVVEEDILSKEGISYPEWDYKNNKYKYDFCKVFPKRANIKSTNFALKTLNENKLAKRRLAKLFNQVNNEYEQVQRVNSGEEFNLDAVTDCFCDIKSKVTPNENIYITKRRKKKDLSILILMDTSLSAEGYTDNQKVLDVEKVAVLLFGEVMEEYGISFQIDAFSSRTRNQCNYTTVKGFKEPWSQAKNKIGSLEAENYTRIGTALRHAGAELEKTDSKRKWIILLSDGKPNDYDTYEGKYGIEDVKKTIQELDNKHIHTFSLAIEAQAKYYLPQMFGHNNYNILSKPSDLPSAFGKFYKKILSS